MQSKEAVVIACEGDLVEAYGKSLAEMDMFDLWLADDPDGNKAEINARVRDSFLPPYDPKPMTPEQWAKMTAEDRKAWSDARWAEMTAKGRAAWADVPDASAWVDDIRGGPVE